MKSNRGFTLIELLVVIAIIGILSSVVLASLNTARQRGQEAAAKASLNNARAQAELFYDRESPGNYTGVCTSPDGILNLLESAVNAVGGPALGEEDSLVRCVVGPETGVATTWAASVDLGNNNFYCVDGSGFAGDSTGHAAVPDDVASCPSA